MLKSLHKSLHKPLVNSLKSHAEQDLFGSKLCELLTGEQLFYLQCLIVFFNSGLLRKNDITSCSKIIHKVFANQSSSYILGNIFYTPVKSLLPVSASCSSASKCGSDRRDHRHRSPGCHYLLHAGRCHSVLLEEQEQIWRGGDSQRNQVCLEFVFSTCKRGRESVRRSQWSFPHFGEVSFIFQLSTNCDALSHN